MSAGAVCGVRCTYRISSRVPRVPTRIPTGRRFRSLRHRPRHRPRPGLSDRHAEGRPSSSPATDGGAWAAQKVSGFVDPSYGGPVLVRGAATRRRRPRPLRSRRPPGGRVAPRGRDDGATVVHAFARARVLRLPDRRRRLQPDDRVPRGRQGGRPVGVALCTSHSRTSPILPVPSRSLQSRCACACAGTTASSSAGRRA